MLVGNKLSIPIDPEAFWLAGSQHQCAGFETIDFFVQESFTFRHVPEIICIVFFRYINDNVIK